MSETVMHTELVTAQGVRCWRREMGSGELRSEEGPEGRELTLPRVLTWGKHRENVGVHRVDRRTPAQTCGWRAALEKR